MDRGRQYYRAFLRTVLLSGVVLATLAGAGRLPAQAPVSPVPSVAVPPPAPVASATPDAARKRTAEKAMVERRQREQATSEQEAQRRVEQLPPEEQDRFKRNLRVWKELSPEEQEAVRKEANDRTRTEVEKAYQESGLRLDKDQREVFGLRYRQERRKLERELQEKLEAERARRLPGVVDELKREFADKQGTPVPMATVTPRPPSAASTPSVSVPAASLR